MKLLTALVALLELVAAWSLCRAAAIADDALEEVWG